MPFDCSSSCSLLFYYFSALKGLGGIGGFFGLTVSKNEVPYFDSDYTHNIKAKLNNQVFCCNGNIDKHNKRAVFNLKNHGTIIFKDLLQNGLSLYC